MNWAPPESCSPKRASNFENGQQRHMSQWESGKEKRAAFLAKSPIATCAAEIVGVLSTPAKSRTVPMVHISFRSESRQTQTSSSDVCISRASIPKICVGSFLRQRSLERHSAPRTVQK